MTVSDSGGDDGNAEHVSSVQLINISGPYGAGKDTLIGAILSEFGSRVHRVHTVTTRPSSRTADPSYMTLAPDEFTAATSGPHWIVNRQLSGTVAYATDLDEIRTASAAGKLCVHSIFAGDAGAGELRRRLTSRLISVSVLVNEGGVEQQLTTLGDRLLARGRESSEEIQQRLDHQYEVIDYIRKNPKVLARDGKVYDVFDHLLINRDLSAAIARIIALVTTAYEGITESAPHDSLPVSL